MQPRHRVSRTAIELIKRFEGYRRAAAQLPDGRWTIGHGHTLTARQGAEVSEDDAEALLLYDLIAIAHALNEAVFTPLTQNQFDALASFAFNLGLDNFHQSGVLKRLNEGALIQAACAMELWRKANIGGERIVVDALVRRRAAEKALFLTPPGDAWVPAPSPILRPLLDTDARDVVPLQAPIEVTTSLDGDRLVVLRDGEPLPPPVAPEEEGPAVAAAEAVSARLSTIFQDSGEEPRFEGEAPAAFKDPRAPLEDPVPFFLRAPDLDAEAAAVEADEPREDDEEQEEGPESRDLFSRPAAQAELEAEAVELEAEAADDAAEAEAGYRLADPFGRDRYVIDDSAPYDYPSPAVRPLPERPEGGVLTLVALAVLGLVFFGGGIFWATNARPMLESHLMGPRTVGGLAGIAGVGFSVVAVYLLLERLGRASERQARHRP
jgi:lysozyme